METIVKERPILFSGAMVRALLDGTKTQTRRICSDQPRDVKQTQYSDSGYADGANRPMVCPYGKPGDQLWVRENFQAFVPGTWAMVMRLDQNCVTAFQATEPLRAAEFNDIAWAGPWRPSIHMPRRLSRILLAVVSVRIERLKDISQQDAAAEGIEFRGGQSYLLYGKHDKTTLSGKPATAGTARESYETLWQAINGPESWDANPWVWVVEFKVISPATPIQKEGAPAGQEGRPQS